MPYKPDSREYRSMAMLAPAQTGEKRIESDYYVEGLATTWDRPYLIAEVDGVKYYERIDRHALDGADLSDVIMQYDHRGRVLARNSNGTLVLDPSHTGGLFIAADLSKSDAARAMYEDISNSLITRMSWAFVVSEDSYDRATHTRTILRIRKVYDVSAVSRPANDDTHISARSWVDGVIDAARRESVERRKQIIRILANT